MAKQAMIVKAARKRRRVRNAIAAGTKPRMATRAYNNCQKCGRTRGYLGFFGLCRICLREAARNAEIPGLRKASW